MGAGHLKLLSREEHPPLLQRSEEGSTHSKSSEIPAARFLGEENMGQASEGYRHGGAYQDGRSTGRWALDGCQWHDRWDGLMLDQSINLSMSFPPASSSGAPPTNGNAASLFKSFLMFFFFGLGEVVGSGVQAAKQNWMMEKEKSCQRAKREGTSSVQVRGRGRKQLNGTQDDRNSWIGLLGLLVLCRRMEELVPCESKGEDEGDEVVGSGSLVAAVERGAEGVRRKERGRARVATKMYLRTERAPIGCIDALRRKQIQPSDPTPHKQSPSLASTRSASFVEKITYE
ncbi:hypothetical protein M407DRAFT_7214 [Tulasnella calospora MUT 4182]|uniref:Uncharacterized protein n=1 Tax=Tulasnella calospora MUT 4182 TaxID=1051891 RepID=A0A0C3L1B9_9AGAM|nr:hypothetical protein M407DRAFT_7214 [Tulasnella calospora MUT 4182]